MEQLRCRICKRFLGTHNGTHYCKKCDLYFPTGNRCFCGRNLDYPESKSSAIVICRCGAHNLYSGNRIDADYTDKESALVL